jgi:hypothetical protein
MVTQPSSSRSLRSFVSLDSLHVGAVSLRVPPQASKSGCSYSRTRIPSSVTSVDSLSPRRAPSQMEIPHLLQSHENIAPPTKTLAIAWPGQEHGASEQVHAPGKSGLARYRRMQSHDAVGNLPQFAGDLTLTGLVIRCPFCQYHGRIRCPRNGPRRPPLTALVLDKSNTTGRRWRPSIIRPGVVQYSI